MCLFNFVSTKILVSLTLAQYRVHCRKQKSGEFSQHIQPPFSKNSLPLSSRSRLPKQHRTRQKAGVTTILHWRQSLRRNIHVSPNYGKCTHRNVILQEVFSNPGLSQQHNKISRNRPPTTLSQREIQKSIT